MGNDYPNIKEILDNFFPILKIFIVGYFVLFVVYDETFLKYDIITRLVLAIVASIVLNVPSAFGVRLASGYDKPLPKSTLVAGGRSITILGMFSIIELFDLDFYLKENPLYYLIIIFIITASSYKIKKDHERGVTGGTFHPDS